MELRRSKYQQKFAVHFPRLEFVRCGLSPGSAEPVRGANTVSSRCGLKNSFRRNALRKGVKQPPLALRLTGAPPREIVVQE
jgi:hypothetical protein